jgi:formylglycine-generating enzyme required for sulfatase activity
MKYNIFISYSRDDFDEVNNMILHIKEVLPSLNIWFDIDGIESGDEFEDKIIDAIDNSEIVLFALSNHSLKSEWAKREVTYAKNEQKRVIPILLKEARLTGWFSFKYGSTDCISIDNEMQWNKLLRNLSDWFSKQDDNEPVKGAKVLVKETQSLKTSDKSKIHFTVNGVSFDMVEVEGGTFWMGSDDSDAWDNEKPIHSETVSTFRIGTTPVTQALWNAVMDSGLYCDDDNIPVGWVSWNACKIFIKKLNSLLGENFRLPTEAEWEYAARGGNKSRGYKYSGSNNIDEVAWYKENSDNKTHPVASKSSNELGLYDMSGNVCEWTSDIYNDNYNTSKTGSCRVRRGGSRSDVASRCRVSCRFISDPSYKGGSLGFRLVL